MFDNFKFYNDHFKFCTGVGTGFIVSSIIITIMFLANGDKKGYMALIGVVLGIMILIINYVTTTKPNIDDTLKQYDNNYLSQFQG